ncbi:hypothetical protein J7T55_002746 [Diaporthe amygdali]|uniref:uncharacterized protein n=1 Tax=Phomopsis amygdali TaxID=1214568 RepID=UPI0022FE7AC7|nr:uncharacterized protein J7T55_002746 [Diaporthe amygdali]KAJ0122234.1 hypothetical protein J7T55_002746 [Diaporthe amygdali]
MAAQPLIILNGWPGVGKDTVAETLSLLIGDNKASLLDWGKGRGDSFQTIPDDDEVAQKAQRDACFADQVEHPSTFSKMIICTDCLSDTPLGRRLAQDFEVVAKRTNRLLIPIYLECQVEENMRRLQEAERRVSLKDKIRSPNEAKTVRSDGGNLFIFKSREGLSINITKMLPHEAALQILSFIRDLIDHHNEELVNEETTPLEASEPAWA